MPNISREVPWRQLNELLSRDPARRGLTGIDGHGNGHIALERAARSLATAKKVAIVTGFFIPDAPQPAAETDGPPGAIFLALALAELGIEPILISDSFGVPLLEAACDARKLPRSWVAPFPFEPLGGRERHAPHLSATTDRWIAEFAAGRGRGLTHLVSIERCGPSHTLESIQAQGADAQTLAQFASEVPAEHRDACHNMRGIDITPFTAKTHRLFEHYARLGGVTTIGIGDGGNELGMGCIPWPDLRTAIPFGPAGQIACRIATDHLLVCGVSNWGGYGLALAVARLRGAAPRLAHANIQEERTVIEHIVRETTAVDGVTRLREATVDGLPLETYLQILAGLRRLVDLPA
jgi:hypothetical protein